MGAFRVEIALHAFGQKFCIHRDISIEFLRDAYAPTLLIRTCISPMYRELEELRIWFSVAFGKEISAACYSIRIIPIEEVYNG